MAIEYVVIEDADGVRRKIAVDRVTVGSDEIHTQLEKLAFSADGVEPVQVSAAAPLPTTDSAASTALAALLTAVDGLEASTDGIEGKQDAQTALLTTIRDNADTLEALLAHGTFAYASGTSAATVDVPAGARAKRVSVVASSAGTATITIAGGSTITVPAEGAFDEQVPGDATLGGDVVIGGNVASYYVAWTVA